MALTWDELPGDVANYVADIEDEVNRINSAIGYEDESYTLDDLATNLENIRDYAQGALQELGR